METLLTLIAQVVEAPPRPGLGISDAVLLALIAMIQFLAAAWINRDSRRSTEATLAKAQEIREAVRHASHKANDVAHDVGLKLHLATVIADTKLEKITQTTQITNELIARTAGETLRLHAETSRRLANITQLPECIVAADKAEQQYAEHQAKQEQADRQ